jgi:hypothetical protein
MIAVVEYSNKVPGPARVQLYSTGVEGSHILPSPIIYLTPSSYPQARIDGQ